MTCAGWCSERYKDPPGGEKQVTEVPRNPSIGELDESACGDTVGKAVAAERKRLQESSSKSKRRAIENVLEGNLQGAAAEVAAIVCVTKVQAPMHDRQIRLQNAKGVLVNFTTLQTLSLVKRI